MTSGDNPSKHYEGNPTNLTSYQLQHKRTRREMIGHMLACTTSIALCCFVTSLFYYGFFGVHINASRLSIGQTVMMTFVAILKLAGGLFVAVLIVIYGYFAATIQTYLLYNCSVWEARYWRKNKALRRCVDTPNGKDEFLAVIRIAEAADGAASRQEDLRIGLKEVEAIARRLGISISELLLFAEVDIGLQDSTTPSEASSPTKE